MSLAIAVLEMPTMSIVKSLEPVWAINWNDARPWIVMLGGVILFLGWELRKKRREIQKLDLEIAQLRSQQSLVRVATIHEMNSLIKDVEEISAREPRILGGAKNPARTFALEGKLLGCFCEVHFPLFSSRPSAGVALSNMEARSEIYGRFMGGSGRNRSNSGRLGQYVQHMQIVQSRINTGYFASC
jgi:hypothetical protein